MRVGVFVVRGMGECCCVLVVEVGEVFDVVVGI